MWVVHVVRVLCLADVLRMSVVRGMRGVSGMCEISMCLARGRVAGEYWMCVYVWVVGG